MAGEGGEEEQHKHVPPHGGGNAGTAGMRSDDGHHVIETAAALRDWFQNAKDIAQSLGELCFLPFSVSEQQISLVAGGFRFPRARVIQRNKHEEGHPTMTVTRRTEGQSTVAGAGEGGGEDGQTRKDEPRRATGARGGPARPPAREARGPAAVSAPLLKGDLVPEAEGNPLRLGSDADHPFDPPVRLPLDAAVRKRRSKNPMRTAGESLGESETGDQSADLGFVHSSREV